MVLYEQAIDELRSVREENAKLKVFACFRIFLTNSQQLDRVLDISS